MKTVLRIPEKILVIDWDGEDYPEASLSNFRKDAARDVYEYAESSFEDIFFEANIRPLISEEFFYEDLSENVTL
jgi:hypothetical protein